VEGSAQLRDEETQVPEQLTIGTKFGRPADDVHIDAKRMNRHTFWCGQSGSGKSYALGVLLERILLQTGLPVLILDPNADYVRLGTARDGIDPGTKAAVESKDVRVLHSTGPDAPRLHVRFLDLSVQAKAAVLRLDPIADADEYNVLLHAESELRALSGETASAALGSEASAYVQRLRASDEPGRKQLATRIENLQVLEWELWARGDVSATEVIDERPDAVVMDIGGFTHPSEPKVAALAVLEHLWAKRDERRPLLIVLDEAHNLCPPNPVTPVEQALTARLVQIAAEGRKFGLWLLLSTQRPTKIHPNVLSQCDNLALMRMSSPRDLVELGDVLGYAPGELLAKSPEFVQGQALLAGGFVNEPTLVQVGERYTVEGGTDVKVPPRAP
jgi:DNA helicase HerA-like ATPase